jgi:hypothetical protein
MSFDTALNLVWILLVAGAMGAFALIEARRFRDSSRRARLKRGLAVFVAMVALFPCISASDDLVTLRTFRALSHHAAPESMSQQDAKTTHPPLDLARLLEVLENFQIARASILVLVFTFLALVARPSVVGITQSLAAASERSPPLPL